MTAALTALACVSAAATLVLSACGSFDDTDATPAPDASLDATTKDSSTADAATVTLPTHAALVQLVGDTFADQLVNNGIVYSYFAGNQQPGHSPTLADVQECLAYQLGSIMGNGDAFPPAPLADRYVCRGSMTAIHASLQIPGPVFTEFVSALVVESAVEGILLPVDTEDQLMGLASQIVDPDAPDAALAYGWENAVDAGSDAGHDSGADAGKPKDAGPDAAPDAAIDSGAAGDGGDASVDSGADAAG